MIVHENAPAAAAPAAVAPAPVAPVPIAPGKLIELKPMSKNNQNIS